MRCLHDQGVLYGDDVRAFAVLQLCSCSNEAGAHGGQPRGTVARPPHGIARAGAHSEHTRTLVKRDIIYVASEVSSRVVVSAWVAAAPEQAARQIRQCEWCVARAVSSAVCEKIEFRKSFANEADCTSCRR